MPVSWANRHSQFATLFAAGFYVPVSAFPFSQYCGCCDSCNKDCPAYYRKRQTHFPGFAFPRFLVLGLLDWHLPNPGFTFPRFLVLGLSISIYRIQCVFTFSRSGFGGLAFIESGFSRTRFAVPGFAFPRFPVTGLAD